MVTQTLPHQELTSEDRRRRGVWKHTPQRSGLRHAIFLVHLWIGVIASIYAIAIGVSGSVLVFGDEIESLLEPRMHLVQPGSSHASLQSLWDELKLAHPKDLFYCLTPAAEPDRTASFVLFPPGKLDRSRIQSVYFNPYSGEILGERTALQGPLGWARNLHLFLMGRESGVIVNGILGIGLVLLCLTGVVIWWPGILRWKRSLWITHRARWKRLNWDLHSAVGFWSCAALLAVSLTGVYIIFPGAFNKVANLISGGGTAPAPATVALPHAPGAMRLSLDQIAAIGQGALQTSEPLSYILLPATAEGVFTAAQYDPQATEYSRLRTVVIDPYSGKILSRTDTDQEPLAKRILNYFNAIHFGTFGGSGVFGVLIKILWVLLGLAPAVLGTTGLIMYWNRYLKKKLRALR